jgi:stearoyl-CoA desaturase (delta-9 desaturase)
MYWQSLW